MQSRNLLFLAAAALVGIVAVLIANAWFSGMEQKKQSTTAPVALAQVVVATQPLEFGTALNIQNVALKAWPSSSVPAGAFRTVQEALKDNRVALFPVVPGEPILASKVSGTEGRATLASILPPGMRAKSIGISDVSGVSGFVLPGTVVDVILTRKIPGSGATSEDYRSDVVLQGVQVLAINQQADTKQGQPIPGKTATLAVSLLDAQRLDIADKIGALSLVLRKEQDLPDLAADQDRRGATVTNRQLGGRTVLVGPGQAPQIAQNYFRPAHTPSLAMPAPAGQGASMTIFRGIEPTAYPVMTRGGTR